MNISCPKCGSQDYVLRGMSYNKSGVKQRYGCKNCKHKYTLQDKTNQKPVKKTEQQIFEDVKTITQNVIDKLEKRE